MPELLKISLIISGASALILSGLFYVSLPLAAQTGTADLIGYAWNNNIGWISFSSTNCDADKDGKSDGELNCPTSGTDMASYGVSVNNADGKFFGYAWSPNIGWISFNQADLAGCPIAPCVAETTQKDGIKKVTGWAKILLTNSWVSLSGKTGDGNSYGVKINPQGEFFGWAWESNVIGWTSFKGIADDGSKYGVSMYEGDSIEPKPAISCYFYAQPASVPEFSKTALYWDCQNVKSCSIDGTAVPNKGSKEITLKKVPSLHTLSCIGLDDSEKQYSVTVKTIRPGIKEVRP